jgi:HAD superfamily hydrolase (TIGR01549 family)
MHTSLARSTTKAIFFDCWGTLFTSGWYEDLTLIAGILGIDYTRDFIKDFERTFMCEPQANLQPAVSQLINKHRGEATPELVHIIEQILLRGLARQQAYPDTLANLKLLHQTYQLGLITNSFQLSYEHLQSTYRLETYFDLLLPSFQIGHTKPDTILFATALQRLKLAPAEVVMVGDSLEDDVMPTQALGWRSILLDRRGRYPEYTGERIDSLAELSGVLQLPSGQPRSASKSSLI